MIGAMRDNVEILRPQRIPDEGGGYSIAYTSIGSVSAKAEARRAARDRSITPMQYRHRKRFLMRRRDDLIFEMRLVYRGDQFRIINIQDQDHQGRFTVVEAEEMTP